MNSRITEKLRQAFGRFNAQDLTGAERLCGEILQQAPRHPDALHLQGMVRLVSGDAREAIALISRALEGNSRNAAMAEHLGLAHLAAQEPGQAEHCFRKALELGASHGLLHMRLGLALGSQGRLDEAITFLKTAAQADPDDVDTHLNLGNALAEAGQVEDAAAAYRRVLALRPAHVDAYYNLGTLFWRARRLDEAIDSFQTALRHAPGYADAHHNLGRVYADQGRLDDAIVSYRRALELQPGHVHSLNSLGTALLAGGQSEAAEELFQKAMAAHPDHPDAYINLGNLRAEQGLYAEARSLFEKALLSYPRSFEAHYNLGTLFARQGEPEAAVDHYRHSLALGANRSDVCNELGSAYREIGNLDEAVSYYRQSIAADSQNVRAYHNLAETLKITGRLDEAAELEEQAVALKADYYPALGALAHLRQHMCMWDGIERLWDRLRHEAIGRQDAVVTPFSTLSWTTSPEEQLTCARAWAAQDLAAATAMRGQVGFAFASHAQRNKLRIGYLSADFRKHALAHLTAELFELHDRQQVEVIAYSCAPDDGSTIRQRIQRACDRFVDVAGESFVATARRINGDEVDILVDLDGWTFGARTRTLALRPAPVQVSWLGYAGTMGSDCVDYVVADPIVIPEGSERYYSEQVVRLPDCYQVSDRRREASDRTPDREECGLPSRGLVFCCFNHAYKILPDVFGHWMRILKTLPDSILWLGEANRWANDNLRRSAAAAGVAAERLVFAARKALPEYLAQFRLADLAIDTFPYTSHTVANDALWMECPLVTCSGETFASRVAASVLINAGLRKLVTESLSDYERLIIELAAAPEQLQELRRKLRETRDSCALFDTPRFVRNLEHAYRMMFDAWAAKH